MSGGCAEKDTADRWPTRADRHRLLFALSAVIIRFISSASAQPVQDQFNASGGCSNPYGCAHPTYPTGTQSHQPNDPPCSNPYGCGRGRDTAPYPSGRDVYCQQSPGQPMYGPYHGTGTQTPCGPNFQPAPQRRPPQPSEATGCPTRVGLRTFNGRHVPSFFPVRFFDAAPGHDDDSPPLMVVTKTVSMSQGISIGGKKVDPASDQDYRCIIKFLTVPVPRQSDPLFTSNDIAAIKTRLEDPLRRQIFDAMAGNPAAFRFQNIDSANENIDIRVEAISFMRSIQGLNALRCGFTSGQPSIWSRAWTAAPLTPQDIAAGFNAPAGRVLDSTAGTGADTAIQDFRNNFSRLDCLGGVELIIFEAVDKIIGASRFNAEHAEGLQKIGLNVPNPAMDTSADDAPTTTGDWMGISIFKNVKVVSLKPIFEMMVPGDWAYMRNDPSYRGVGFMGENTIYMGKYNEVNGNMTGNGQPVYLKPTDPGYNGMYSARFTGLGGESDKSIGDLAADLKNAFVQSNGTQPDPTKIGWTMLARPKAGGAGPGSAGSGPSVAAGTAFDQ